MSSFCTGMSHSLIDRTLGLDAHHPRRDDELAGRRVAELGDVLGEPELAAALALLLPLVALPLTRGEDHARTHRLVVLEVLLGMEAATAAPSAAAHTTGRFATRS